ncbi:MAG: EamA family transporter [Proteobacteria bacterium]|nr:EamA family transporter [Pseudomonadota bacterium]
MDPIVVALVLAAALMHALWNTVLKIGDDRLVAMATIMFVTGTLAPILILWGPAPAAESWKFIVLSAALNTAYFYFLLEAYRVGDLSHAYPLARGSAPLMVAVGAAVFAGEALSATGIAGVVIISGAIAGLAFSGGFESGAGWRTIAYPLATGAMTAAYTVVDGIGVRASGSPAGYIGWLFVLSATPITAFALIRRKSAVIDVLGRDWRSLLLGGVLNFGSFGLVIWALSLSAMAHVSALRETSVIIAALIGACYLGEPFGLHRVLSAIAVAAGVLLLSLAA